jgi:hypothetical protein
LSLKYYYAWVINILIMVMAPKIVWPRAPNYHNPGLLQTTVTATPSTMRLEGAEKPFPYGFSCGRFAISSG